ncbi:MAG: ComEC/Rec2 family competence protein, partial [Anaerolineales bacterium]|nr:ComEC/Rec2 family competence protein [Anaerolineales bacterium]
QLGRPVAGPELISWYNDTGTSLSVVGLVVGPPDERDTYTNLRVRVERLRPGDEIIHTGPRGVLLARLPPGGGWRYGDRVVLTGSLETPPEDEAFSYRAYLARQGVFSLMSNAKGALLERGAGSPVLAALFALRFRAEEVVYQIFPDPEASLAAGILLGIETGIPEDVKDAFTATGTSHVIAISGFNITILAGLFMAGFGRLFGLRWGALAAAAGVGGYTILVGADAAVVRAAIMGLLAILARQAGRRQAALNSLAFTAALMALFNPLILGDVGFQLSFAATLGLVLYADPLSQSFVRFAGRVLPEERAQKLAGPAGEYFLFTLAAQLTTLPVTVYHFQRLSLSSLVANPAILPVQPAVMILGGLAVLLGLVSLPAGQLAGLLVWPFVAYTTRVVELFAGLPMGSWSLGEIALGVVAAYYGLMLALTFWPQGALSLRATLTPVMPLTIFGILAVVAWRGALALPDGRLHLTMMDVGVGDGLLIESPGGRFVLVDGGPRATRLSDALGRRLPPGGRRLDYLVVAAPLKEQVGGLPGSLERFPPRQVIWAGPPNASWEARRLGELLAREGLPVTPARPGQALDLGGGVQLEVLAAGRRGAVLLLRYGNFTALLPIGLDFELLGELDNGRRVGEVTVLLLAEGGYGPANPAEWIAALRPQLALLSVGAGNREGLPSTQTLENLQGYPLLRTDRNGWVEITTDGRRMWVEAEREE